MDPLSLFHSAARLRRRRRRLRNRLVSPHGYLRSLDFVFTGAVGLGRGGRTNTPAAFLAVNVFLVDFVADFFAAFFDAIKDPLYPTAPAAKTGRIAQLGMAAQFTDMACRLIAQLRLRPKSTVSSILCPRTVPRSSLIYNLEAIAIGGSR